MPKMNDLYIQMDEGTLWTNDMFKDHYNHYRGVDEKWSKPFDEWKKWFTRENSFIKLEQFLENNWQKIENAIDKKHSDFIEQFQNGKSKSEIFLNFICLFEDVDTYFKDTLWLDIDDIRETVKKGKKLKCEEEYHEKYIFI